MGNQKWSETAGNGALPFTTGTELRDTHSSLLKRHSEILKAGKEMSDDSKFLDDLENFIRRGKETGVYLDADAERWDAQSLLNYWATTLYRAGRKPPDVNLAEFQLDKAPYLPDSSCPYQGLDAFNETDQDKFFGRGKQVETLIKSLKKSRLLILYGSSGSGKSSLVFAGLLPELRKGALPGSKDSGYFSMVPGTEPLKTLAIAARPAKQQNDDWTQQQIKLLTEKPDHLLQLLPDLLENIGKPREADCVFIVDQFEELFTLCTGETRNAFVDNLLSLIERPDARHTVIVTMRSDYVDRIVKLEKLTRHTVQQSNMVLVSTLGADDLRAAIEEPAKNANLKFEEGIVDQLIKGIIGEEAGLPLLQFTLLKLWDKRERNRVTLKAYEELGGPREALRTTADTFYEGLKLIEDKEVVRRIMLRLVRPGVGDEVTRNRVTRKSLNDIEAEDRVKRVLDKLIEERLVRQTKGETPDDTQVEISHEALARNWPMLIDWLRHERDDKRQRLRLTAAADQWKTHGRDPGGLYGGSLLAEARGFLKLAPLEDEFIQASIKAEQEKEAANARALQQAEQLAKAKEIEAKRWRAAVIVLVVGVLPAALILGIALLKAADARKQAQKERDDARVYAGLQRKEARDAVTQAKAAVVQAEGAVLKAQGEIVDTEGKLQKAQAKLVTAQGKVRDAEEKARLVESKAKIVVADAQRTRDQSLGFVRVAQDQANKVIIDALSYAKRTEEDAAKKIAEANENAARAKSELEFARRARTDAEGEAKESEQLLVEATRERAAAGSLSNGIQLYQQRKFPEAEQEFTAAMKYYSVNNKEIGADLLVNLGSLQVSSKQDEKAIQFFQSAQEIYKRNGDTASEANLQYRIGNTYSLTADELTDPNKKREYKQKALSSFQQAVSAFSSLKNRGRESFTWYNMGDVYSSLGEKDKALAAYGRALSIQKDLKDDVAVANTFNEIGRLYASMGKTKEADTNYQEALKHFGSAGQQGLIGRAKTLNNLGDLYVSKDNKKAFKNYQESLERAQELPNKSAKQIWVNEALRDIIKNLPADKCSSPTKTTLKQLQSTLSL